MRLLLLTASSPSQPCERAKTTHSSSNAVFAQCHACRCWGSEQLQRKILVHLHACHQPLVPRSAAGAMLTWRSQQLTALPCGCCCCCRWARNAAAFGDQVALLEPHRSPAVSVTYRCAGMSPVNLHTLSGPEQHSRQQQQQPTQVHVHVHAPDLAVQLAVFAHLPTTHLTNNSLTGS